MDQPKRASDTPFPIEVEAGKAYFWCACGLSQNQPFCDGSHKDSGFSPVRFDADKTGKVYFCGCKATANQPLCDGSHNR
ncbi:MAG: CDGSH iron-sulfur domain-containing protein [Pseudomonadales bacterium]|nr:CDGSH iron-sulfur domain-containing protein [Halioglobus sp.]MCP5130270.1 CDGSH iron-sulfur domain-containing protein [Pseudomonadales bacterium]